MKKEEKTYTNYNIFPGKVRLIKEDGSQVVIDRDEAISLAESKSMDLVQIAYNKGSFPAAVCKIIDYSKFKYEKSKREKAAKKAAKSNECTVKEMSFSIRIDDGDLNVKVNHIVKFIEDNCKVKVAIKLSRRESNMLPFAKTKMEEILNKIGNIAELDTKPTFSGNVLSCIIKPKKQ